MVYTDTWKGRQTEKVKNGVIHTNQGRRVANTIYYGGTSEASVSHIISINLRLVVCGFEPTLVYWTGRHLTKVLLLKVVCALCAGCTTHDNARSPTTLYLMIKNELVDPRASRL